MAGRRGGPTPSSSSTSRGRGGWSTTRARSGQVTERVAREALDDAGVLGQDLDGIGITNQRETAVAWDRDSGEPLHRAIVWQDRRTAGLCDQLREAGHEPLFRERTGLVLDAYFSGTKYRWLLADGGVDERALLGTIDSWLAYKLTRRARDRRVQCLAHAALQHPRRRVGRRAVRPARGAHRSTARAGGQRAGVRPDERVRRERSGLRHGRRPAGGVVRPGLPRARPGQEHLRHGQLPAPERGHGLAAAGAGAHHHDRLEARRRPWSTRWSRACS